MSLNNIDNTVIEPAYDVWVMNPIVVSAEIECVKFDDVTDPWIDERRKEGFVKCRDFAHFKTLVRWTGNEIVGKNSGVASISCELLPYALMMLPWDLRVIAFAPDKKSVLVKKTRCYDSLGDF